jgi:hypothetical protein
MIPASGPDVSARPGVGTLALADIEVTLEGLLCPAFSTWPDSYQPFLSAGSGRPGDVRFRLGAEDRHPADARFVSTYAAGSWQGGTMDGRTVYRFHADRNHPYLWAEPDADFRAVDVWLEMEGGRRMPPLLHPVDRVLCMGVLAHRGGFIVHSCGWSCNGKSVLFPGVSGAGKTTICRQLMAAGHGVVLSDDRVVLREEPAGFRACGTPWPGDAKQARNESAPLAALCFIEKSPEPYLWPIRSTEAFRRLLEAASVPWFSPGLRDRVLPLVERLVTTVPAFRLGFRPEPGVVDSLLPLVGFAPSSQDG